MPRSKDLLTLQHIIESTSKICYIVLKHKNFKSFEKDWISQDAMNRNFEIIGEAVAHVSEQPKFKFPDVEWS